MITGASALSGTAHTAALLELANTAAVRLYEGEAPSGAKAPYAVLWVSNGTTDIEDLSHEPRRLDLTFQITSIGLDRAGPQDIADRLRTALIGRRPQVPGRTSSRITQVTSRPLARDDSKTTSLLYLVDVYAWWTTPAPEA